MCSRCTRPVAQSTFRRCTISSASGELILLPKPLSVIARKRSPPSETMAEKPCTDWPRTGSAPPDARGCFGSPTKVLAGMAPSVSVRSRLGAVNLPAVAKKAPASRGAATVVSCGSSA